MSRLLFLIAIVTLPSLLNGQGFGDMNIIANSFTEEQYQQFIRAARHDSDSSKVVMLKGLYGKYLILRQRYPEAETELFSALDIINKIEPSLHAAIRFISPSIYDIYDYLGEYYTVTGDYKKAEFYLKSSEQKRTLHFPRGSPHRIRNIQTLAEFYISTKQLLPAEAYLEKLINELTHTRFNNQMLRGAYGSYFNGMTDLSIRQGRLDEARSFFKKLVKFQAGPFSSYKGALRNRWNNNVNTMSFRSRILLVENKPEEALQQVQQINLTDSLKALPEMLQIKALCLYQLNRPVEALAAAQTLLKVHLHNIRKVFYTLNEMEQETMFNRIRDDFDLYNSLAITAASENPLDKKSLEEIVDFRLQTKALLLNYSRKLRQAIFASRDSSLINRYQRLSVLKSLASKEAYRKKSARKINQYDDEIKQLEEFVSRQVARKSAAVESQPTVTEIQQRLGDPEAAVEMIRVRKIGMIGTIKESHARLYGLTDTIFYFSVVLTKNSIDYRVLKDGNKLEGRYLSLFRNSAMLENPDTLLWHVYWSGIDQLVSNKTKVYFSADGVYNQINLSLLKKRSGYLGDHTALICLSNLREILNTENRISPGNAVFFGWPDFHAAVRPGNENASRGAGNFQLEEMKTSDFADLPGTKVEIDNASLTLTRAGWKALSYSGDEATEYNLKKVASPELLHIATHGFFLEGGEINPMLRSGLIFAGVKNNEETDGEDGVLTAYEASNLNLDSTRLVVLSACDTGTGEERNGEGIYGLQRAFMIAGAQNIMMSLWKVDDEATQKLMTLFYVNLAAGKDVRSAFSMAQAVLRKDYPAPFYWGAFVLIGK
jgi:CHAT domain-containing protein